MRLQLQARKIAFAQLVSIIQLYNLVNINRITHRNQICNNQVFRALATVTFKNKTFFNRTLKNTVFYVYTY